MDLLDDNAFVVALLVAGLCAFVVGIAVAVSSVRRGGRARLAPGVGLAVAGLLLFAGGAWFVLLNAAA